MTADAAYQSPRGNYLGGQVADMLARVRPTWKQSLVISQHSCLCSPMQTRKMDSQQALERDDFIMSRPRAPPTNAAVFAEINDLALGGPASVYVESLDRLGSLTEARKQTQIRSGHPGGVKLPICYKNEPNVKFSQC